MAGISDNSVSLSLTVAGHYEGLANSITAWPHPHGPHRGENGGNPGTAYTLGRGEKVKNGR